MGTGLERVDRIGRTVFGGRRIAVQVAEYSRLNQQLAHELARELEASSVAAEAAMRELKDDPRVQVHGIRMRAWRVARHLRQARELASGVSAEMVKFNVQFRREFIEDGARGEKRDTSGKDYKGRVAL